MFSIILYLDLLELYFWKAACVHVATFGNPLSRKRNHIQNNLVMIETPYHPLILLSVTVQLVLIFGSSSGQAYGGEIPLRVHGGSGRHAWPRNSRVGKDFGSSGSRVLRRKKGRRRAGRVFGMGGRAWRRDCGRRWLRRGNNICTDNGFFLFIAPQK